ncbi:MAG TPA: DinB family protein [Ilumatobacteraceae bacterium]|nr:DinB family protein [Ilumatobacteraceae bacterium]
MLDVPFVYPPFDPEVAPYGGEERDVVNWLLDYQRYVLLRKVDGITEQQARMTTASSDLTLLGLVRHLAGVEQYWLGSVFLGLNETLPWDDPNDRDSDFHPQENDTLADALVLLRAEIDRARQLASTTPLDALSVGRRENQQVNLRWILVHLVEEYARHCGHADLLRESIDGATGD